MNAKRTNTKGTYCIKKLGFWKKVRSLKTNAFARSMVAAK